MDEGSNEDTTRELKESRAASQFALVLSGVLPGDRTRIALARAPLVLGRALECDVQLKFGEVSRRHAEIVRDGSTFVLRDAGSTNGIYLNGRRVRYGALRDGSVIRMGKWLGVVEGLAPDEMGLWCAEVAPGLIGGSRLVRGLAPLRAAARSTLPIVLVGDTGTGKERFAAAIHYFSGRTGPLHAVNCAALPAELAESELFGHERGAFTGADGRTSGHFRSAEGGTLFLDELPELSASLQAKVLRAVESKRVTALGGNRSLPYDARLVVASQCPLSELVAAGRFRKDLAVRLSGLVVSIASLEERRSDVPSLFDYFLKEHASGVVPATEVKVYERLCLYGWPGNVRELELLARRMLALHKHGAFSLNDLPEEFELTADTDGAAFAPVFETRDEEEFYTLNVALAKTGGNVTRAAELANISRARAYRLLGRHSADKVAE